MSTTRFWGDPDDGDKVRRAEERPLYEMGGNISGSNWGNGWPDNICESYHIVRIRILYEYRISNIQLA